MPESLAELRERVELMERLAAAQGVAPEPEEDDGLQLLLLEILGEFVKQQIVQGAEDPEITQEYFVLSQPLDQASVSWLLEQGWRDPHVREWADVPIRESRNENRVSKPRPGLKPVLQANPFPASLFEEIGHTTVRVEPEMDMAKLVAREVQRIQEETLAAARQLEGEDDDTPPELRPQWAPPKRKKPKKAKKHRYDGDALEPDDTQRYYLDGSPVVAPTIPSAPSPAEGLAEALAAAPAETGPAWVKDEGGKLFNTTKRVPVKAVYPPVRGTAGGKRLPKAISMGGLTSGDAWVRDPATGRKVPQDQVNGQ